MVQSDRADHALRKGIVHLLEIKDSDIRILTLQQARDAVDRGIHAGGAFSAVVPLVSIYYTGVFCADIQHPTLVGQDLFVLSKGHAIATLASIYADLGYFDRSVLTNSRSIESALNGHPGPLLPGVHLSTGPEGHGLSVAEGFALAGRIGPKFDVYALTGDGELQAGMVWEAAMFSGAKHLDNLCVLVDKNEGQLDNPNALQFPMPNVHRMFESFGWRVFNVTGMEYEPVVNALETFKYGDRDGRPTAVICNTVKGFGGFSSRMISHKLEVSPSLVEQELQLQVARREERVHSFLEFFDRLDDDPKTQRAQDVLRQRASQMNLELVHSNGEVRATIGPAKTKQASVRDKKVNYDLLDLPRLDTAKQFVASSVITDAMKVFSRSGRVVSVDADLGSTSGLQGGVGYVDVAKALNVGVAESNMMGIGEGFAILGFNTWVSTFCPFFDWRVLRRTAINYQERKEAIETGSWLSDGHNLDLTFLATAPNFDTKTNGATHMGNDDALVFSELAHLKVIDTSCPNQVLAIMRWIMEGNKGLVYLRIMRAPSPVIYEGDFDFEWGKGWWLRGDWESQAFIVSSGRQVHESLAASSILEAQGFNVGVIDMPSIDEDLFVRLHQSQKKVFLAEQNNGWLLSEMRKALFRRGYAVDPAMLVPINALDSTGHPQYIHSGTYEQLILKFSLAPTQLADAVTRHCKQE